jgi:40S ribosome biogenesis protein Tsr1 and BMS1 C-terminal
MLAVQKAGAGQAGWRVSATGVVTGIEAAPAVVKKLKLVGHPFKVCICVGVYLCGKTCAVGSLLKHCRLQALMVLLLQRLLQTMSL